MAHPLDFPVRSRSIKSSPADDLPPRYSFESGKENLTLGRRGSKDLSPIDSRDEEDESFGPFNPRTWGKEPPPFLQNGTLLPAARRPVPRPRTAPSEKMVTKVLARYGFQDSTQDLAPDCDQFLRMMDEKLQLEERKRALGIDGDVVQHIRSTSSSYPSQGTVSVRVQSPDSIARHYRLSMSDVSRFSQANHRLSNLRSSSSVSAQHESRASSSREVLEESSSAISQWQKELRPRPSTYLQYELTDSAEVLPSDSLSQQKTPSSYNSPYRQGDSPSLRWGGLRAIRAQYDGTHEAHSPLRPDPHQSSPPPYAIPTYAQDVPKQQQQQQSNKRKASYFSLKSLSIASLTKRPRVGLRKWANNVYQQGSNRLRQARQKFREHAELDRRAFEAWRERRRRNAAASTANLPKAKPAPLFADQKNEDWWKDGVSRFEAPKSMLFRAGSILSMRR